MTAWHITGNKDAVLIGGLPSGVDNDQGTVRYGGNVADTDRWTPRTLGDVNRVITVVSGVNGVSGALAAGTFNGGDQVIKRVTTDIAGVSNTVLLGGDSNSAKNSVIHQRASSNIYYYKTAIRSNQWSVVSGWYTEPSVANSGAWSQATDTETAAVLVESGVDNAGNPSQAIPGEFVYRNGSPAPVQADYPAKTVW